MLTVSLARMRVNHCCSCPVAVVHCVWLVASANVFLKSAAQKFCSLPIAIGSRHSTVNLLTGTAGLCNSVPELFCSTRLPFCYPIFARAYFSLMLVLEALLIVADLYTPWLSLLFVSLALQAVRLAISRQRKDLAKRRRNPYRGRVVVSLQSLL